MDDEFSKRDAFSGISVDTGSDQTYATGPVVDLLPGDKHPSGLRLRMENGVPVLPVASRMRSLNLVGKRGLDLVLSVLALVVLSPVLLGIAILVKITSPGPVLFVQDRPGYLGVNFPLLKFRTMHADRGDATGVAQTRANDPRITPIGNFLRRTSLDELPQLLNILAGHMSLVGPRPHPANMWAGGMLYRELVPYYDLRLVMRPGLSGWAQANGFRGPTLDAGSARERIEHDMAYIQNFSLALDLRIIPATLRKEFLGGTGI
jgi:lipopolysaccharide/colanic/teichoic acid biosynthesis glycosyltransferase